MYSVSIPATTFLTLQLILSISAHSLKKLNSPFYEHSPSAVSQQSQEIAHLRLGQSIEKKITGAETHFYKVKLTGNQVLVISVEQRGVDLALALRAPDGSEQGDADSPNGAWGNEEIIIVADQTGDYQLEIKPYAADLSHGSYKAAIKTLRVANVEDKNKFKAYQILSEASKLNSKDDAVSMQAALKKYEEALQNLRELNDVRGQALSLFYLGFTKQKLTYTSEAIDYYKQSLPFWIILGEKSAEAVLQNYIGQAFVDKGEADEAKKAFDRALIIYQSLGDRKEEANIANSVGQLYFNQSQYLKALEYFNQALPVFQSFKDSGEGNALANIGAVYSEIGEYRKAMDYLSRALPLLKINGDQNEESRVYMITGDVNFLLGDYHKALDSYTQSLTISQTTGDRYSEAQALNNIGKVYLLQGNTTESKKFLEKALTVANAADDHKLKGYIFNNIGLTYLKEGNTAQALAQSEKALPLLRELKNLHGEAQTLNNIGTILLASGEGQRAIENFNSALALNRETKEKAEEATTLGNLMDGWEILKSPRMAIFYGKQAVNLYQNIRFEIKTLKHELQKTFLNSVEDTYRKLAELLVKEGRLPEAEQVLAMLKEEEYSRLVRRGGDLAAALNKRINLSPAEKGAIERYEKIADQITALGNDYAKLEKELDKPNITDENVKSILARRKEINEKLTDARIAVRNILEVLKKEFTQMDARVTTVEGLQMDVKSWGDPHAVVISTIVGKEELSIIVTTPETQTPHIVPIPEEKINTLVGNFRAALTDPKSDPKPAAQKLYDVLIKPLEKDLSGARAQTLIWSLDGNLRYAPMAALWDKDKGYLVERFSNVVITLASSSKLEKPLVDKKAWQALGVGVSKAVPGFEALSYVPEELGAIVSDAPANSKTKRKSILSGRLLLDEKFTFDAFGFNLRRYPIVHAATHFSFISGSKDEARESFLLLGNGENLTLAKIQDSGTNFNGVQLLTLSACDTAFGGKDADGSEIEGFGALAQKLGARAVMATLWRVADESTRDLMVEFYDAYQKDTMTKAKALRLAQLALLHESDKSAGARASKPAVDSSQRFKHPYYWGSYILIGNWW